jgi:SAM-dependent methyltransferase
LSDELLDHNRLAWNQQCRDGNEWTIPESPDVIARARRGDWDVILTPLRTVPKAWFGDLSGKNVLCLASGGGQQAPVLAAAGATVVSYDLSDEQLARDQMVAQREGLAIECIRGDMADLSVFAVGRFDLIFHPVSNVFALDVRAVWKECARVLRDGGSLLAGFMNPAYYLFDYDEAKSTGRLEAKYRLPYSELDPDQLTEKRKAEIASGWPIEFSHTFDAQIGGQLDAGFLIAGFYEDYWTDEATPLNRYSPTFIATWAVKRQ